MEMTIEHLGAVQFEIKTRHHTIICDQPIENGGFDEGVTPPELLLASLGSCMAYYAAEYLSRKKLATEGTRVRISADKMKNPARIDNFRVLIDTPGEFGPEHEKGIRESVERCLIHNTLQHPPSIIVEIHSVQPAT